MTRMTGKYGKSVPYSRWGNPRDGRIRAYLGIPNNWGIRDRSGQLQFGRFFSLDNSESKRRNISTLCGAVVEGCLIYFAFLYSAIVKCEKILPKL